MKRMCMVFVALKIRCDSLHHPYQPKNVVGKLHMHVFGVTLDFSFIKSVHCSSKKEYAYVQFYSIFSSRLTCTSILFACIIWAVVLVYAFPIAIGGMGVATMIILLVLIDLLMLLP